jgi:acyl transferase domain-containing protein
MFASISILAIINTFHSMTLQTGCSSSLVGLHEACQALYSGECSSAIVAGTNLILAPTMTTTMSENLVLSPSGICRTFDEMADGYGRGEAINAIYIKRLDDAIRSNDPIRAVIRATSTNCDGKTPGITTPGSLTQERLIRNTYKKACIENISQTAFFECHGTGTTIGDTAETSVVAKVFENHGTVIGSVISSILSIANTF